jgi:hypothetical protein
MTSILPFSNIIEVAQGIKNTRTFQQRTIDWPISQQRLIDCLENLSEIYFRRCEFR